MLLKVELRDPRGKEHIWNENNKKWRQVLNEYLVDFGTVWDINGGRGRYTCSLFCLDEESLEEGSQFQFIDSARFAL